jgi:quercetin dioxygenase-like cupin family protein
MIIANMTARRGLALAAVLAGGIALAGPAYAGSCPADKLRPDGSGEKMNATAAKDVTDTVVTSIDIAREPAAVKDRLLRLRRLEIKPGGVVPWHAHANRPAIIYIVQGEVIEYASTCAVPIVHRAGEAAAETHATAHWWKNTGSQTVVLLSADLFPTKTSDEHMM